MDILVERYLKYIIKGDIQHMDITIKSCDGKPFHGSDYYSLEKAVKQYEAELKLKKEKEEAERKAREEK